MSITIESDAPRSSFTKEEPCLCAQNSDYFSNFYQGEDSPQIREDLKANAYSQCPSCHGAGIESVETDDAPFLNFSNPNAVILFRVLDVDINKGSLSLPEARRALIRANSRASLKEFVRPPHTEYGSPREVSPGVIDMRPIRWHDFGVPEKKIQSYLDDFRDFLAKVIEKGATKIFWS